MKSELSEKIKFYRFDREGTENGKKVINDLIQEQPSEQYYPDVEIGIGDHIVYIFTSGTTGFPKAAIYPHSRYECIGIKSYFKVYKMTKTI